MYQIMNQYKSSLQILALAGIIVFCFASINNLNRIMQQITQPISSTSQNTQFIKIKEFEKIEKALKTTIKIQAFDFKDNFDPPFQKLIPVNQRETPTIPLQPVEQKKLFLKGTLLKDNALAIIEDEAGKTYICKEGDKIHNRTIALIKDNKVTIKDVSGTEVLNVKEQ